MQKLSLIAFFLLSLLVNLVSQTTRTYTQESSVRVYTDVARDAGSIKAGYPYDISLRNAAGDTLSSDQVFAENGQPTVLLFWLTTCAPCRLELKAVAEKYEKWRSEADFNLYAVSIDWPHNAEAFMERVEQSGWPFPAYHDFRREFGAIMPGNLNGLPQVFILDGNGKIIHHKRKYRPGDEDAWFEVVRSLAKN